MIEASQADQMPAIRDGLQGFRETEKRRMRQMVKLLARAFFGLHEVIISQRLRNSYSSSSHLARSKHLAAIGAKGSYRFGEEFCLPTAGRTFDDGGSALEPDKTRDVHPCNSPSIP